MKKIIRDEPCPSCRRNGRDKQGNHLMVFDDGGKYCNRCGYVESIKSSTSNDNEEDDQLHTLDDINALQSLAVRYRGISEDTMARYGVKVAVNTSNREPEEVFFPYHKEGKIVGYKARKLDDKVFYAIGSLKKPELFGQNYMPAGGKFIIITEGEFDCLAASQMLYDAGKRYRVVSLPNGANSSAIKDNFDYISSFDKIVLAFDQDEVGQRAAKECAELLSVGSVALAKWSGYKDVNEILLAGEPNVFLSAVMNAQTIRPDGILTGLDIIAKATEKVDEPIALFPYKGLNDLLRGIYCPQLITITAGSGVGKSQFLREVVYHILQTTNINLGLMFMEESVQRTALSLAGLTIDKPLHLTLVDEEVKKRALNAIFAGDRVALFDHFGSSEVDYIFSKIRYFAKALSCKIVIVDHLSIIVSGQDSNMDERKLIDFLMTKMRMLAQELDITIVAVSHLRRPEGKGFEEGTKTTLNALRGSHSIAQLSDVVIGLERNQQAEDEDARNLTTVRVLKSRLTGMTGEACQLLYDHETGRLKEKQSWE